MSSEKPNQKRKKEKGENTLELQIQKIIAKGNTPSISKIINPNPTKLPPPPFPAEGSAVHVGAHLGVLRTPRVLVYFGYVESSLWQAESFAVLHGFSLAVVPELRRAWAL